MSALRPDDPENLLAQSNWLRRLARGLVRDEDAAEDLAQDTWVAALRAKPAELQAWMTVVARNFARRGKRDAGLRAAHEPHGAREERVEGPDEIAARVELQRKLAEALLALEEPFRSALVLRYLDGLSSIEVAERLDCSHDAARQRISRGLAKLREKLDREDERGRAGWMSALVPLVHAPKTTITGGLLLMGTKTKLVAALAVAALGLWIWKGPLAPSALEPEAHSAAPLAPASEPKPETAPVAELDSSHTDTRAAVEIPTAASRAANPAPENVLRGIVLDPRDRPVEGALVRATSSLSYDYQMLDLVVAARTEEAGRTQSAADGRFELTLDPARFYQLSVEKPGFAAATLGRRRTGETVTVHLPFSTAIEGHVTQGEQHLPVANAHMRAFPNGNVTLDGAMFEQTATTDARGFYRLDSVPPGPLFLEASAQGLPTSNWFELQAESGKTLTQDVNLAAQAWFRGHVLDAQTRAPIEGAELGTIWVLEHTARSDATGAFTLPLDGGSDGQIYVRAAGYGFQNFPQAADAEQKGADGLELLMQPARKASGRVVDEQARPIAGAYVAACGTDFGAVQRHDWVGATTDAEGRYTIADLRPDLAHSLFVRAQGFGSCVYEFPASEKTQTQIQLDDVVLRPAGSISGFVVDENDKPIPDLRLSLRGANADRGRWDKRGGAFLDTYVAEREGRSDDRGAFTFDELAAGEYEVVLRRDSHQVTANHAVSLQSGERRGGIKLTVPTGLTLEGRVRDHEGNSVVGVYVSIEPTAPGLSDCDVRSDKDGRFAAHGIVPGRYRIQLWPRPNDTDPPAEKFFVHTVFEDQRADGHALELVIEDGVWLKGVVVEADGTPAAGVLVSAHEEHSEFGQSGLTDAQGRFRLGVEHDKPLLVEAKRTTGQAGLGRSLPSDDDPSHWGRVPQAVGGGPEVRVVMPAK